MSLIKCALGALLIFWNIESFAEKAEKKDLRDFRYQAELSINKNDGFWTKLSEVFFDSEIEAEIKKLKIFAWQDKTVDSLTALFDRINSDIETINKIMHVMGYYNAKVKYKIKREKPLKVLINVEPQNLFKLKTSLKLIDQPDSIAQYYLALCSNKIRNKSASMENIKQVITDVLVVLQCNGFYKPEAIKKKVFIDYDKEEALLDLEVACGANVRFGKTDIQAFSGINPQFIRNRLNWLEGETYNLEKVQSSISDLRDTQIFSSVKIEPKDEVSENKTVPMSVEVKEDKKHIIDFSVMYAGVKNMNFEKKSQTSKGLKSIITRVSWSRVNAFGSGEKLTVNAEGMPMKTTDKRVDYAFEVILDQPDLWARNSMMEYSVSRRQELTNVFFKKVDRVELQYNYPISNVLSSKIGFLHDRNYVDSSEIFFRHKQLKKYYRNYTLPVTLIWNQTDDIFNPTSGFKITSKFSFTKLQGAQISSLKSYSLSFAYNRALDELKKNVLALCVTRKGLFGGNIDKIPLDKRIYAGGMNSVRGFGHQMAAEIVPGEDAIMGGKSSLEISGELRRKIKNNWGIAAFSEGAKIYGNRSEYFETEKKRWFFSVGVGVRYYTEMGPIRLDFAFPIKRRRGVDSKMQFIMSLGQAF